MIGLGLGISPSEISDTGLTWGATKFLDLPGASGDFARVQSFSSFLGRISGSGGSDIADTLTISFWIKPTWTMAASGSNQHVTSSGANANNVQLFVFGNTTTEKDRVRVVYMVDTGASHDRNRIMIQAMDPSNNQEREESPLHSNDSVTEVGSTLTTSGITSGWWHKDNQGSVNSDGFVHLAFTRAAGDWSIYWNGTAMGGMIDADSGTLGFTESNVDEMWLGRDFATQDDFKMGHRDIAIFNAELNATQVAELYNSGNLFDVRTHSQAANLGLYWPCEDAQEFSGAGASANLDLQGNTTFSSI